MIQYDLFSISVSVMYFICLYMVVRGMAEATFYDVWDMKLEEYEKLGYKILVDQANGRFKSANDFMAAVREHNRAKELWYEAYVYGISH
jgi:hypothetical protein